MAARTGSFILDYAVPSLGCLLTIILFLTPLQEVLRIHRRQALHGFNLTPYPLMILNNLTWILYALTLPKPSCIFVFLANWFGCISGALILGVTYPLGNMMEKIRITSIFMAMTVICMPICFLLFELLNQDAFSRVIGYLTIIMQFIFFASPLLNILTIIRTKSSEILYAPLAIMTCVATFCWSMYGYVLKNPTILLPNVMAFSVGAIQVVLCCIYPSGARPLVHEIIDEPRSDTQVMPWGSNAKRLRFSEDTALLPRKASV